MPRQLWIADRCRAFGLKTVEVDGWKTRGKESFSPHGVVCHHTGGAPTGEMPSLRVLIHGRSDLPGPLCQVGLARSGAVYIVAAGRANHAGRGSWRGLSGNSSVLGIEAENNGGQPWPNTQLKAYHKLAAALITGPGVGGDVKNVCAHKEWAPGRKPDPHSIDMDDFRAEVTQVLLGNKEIIDMDEPEVRKLLEEYIGKLYAPGQTVLKSLIKLENGEYKEHLHVLEEKVDRLIEKLDA